MPGSVFIAACNWQKNILGMTRIPKLKTLDSLDGGDSHHQLRSFQSKPAVLHLQLAIATLISSCQQFINGGIVPLGAFQGLQHLAMACRKDYPLNVQL